MNGWDKYQTVKLCTFNHFEANKASYCLQVFLLSLSHKILVVLQIIYLIKLFDHLPLKISYAAS